MVGSAIAIGFFAGVIEHRRRSGVYRYYPPEADAADVMPEDGRSHEPRGVYPFYGREHARPLPSRRWSGEAEPRHSHSESALAELWKPLRSLWDELKEEAGRERDRVQNTVLLAGRAFIQDLVRIAGQSLLDQLDRSSGSGISRQGQRRAPYG
jgi:hypothetical protein